MQEKVHLSNDRPRRAGPVWLWALVLLVILITLFVLLRRDAAAQEAGGFNGGDRVEALVVAPGDAWVDASASNCLIYKGLNTTNDAGTCASKAPEEAHETLEQKGGLV
jgi:hypothetical protein